MKIKHRILLSSLSIIFISMFFVFLVFYFFIYHDLKEEKVLVFESQSINILNKFQEFVDVHKKILDTYTLEKEFNFVLNENYFISSLSVSSSKKLIEKIKTDNPSIKEVYLFNGKKKEIFHKKLSVDFKEVLDKRILLKKRVLFLADTLSKEEGTLVFEIDLELFDFKDTRQVDISYFILSDKNDIFLHSSNFVMDENIKFMQQEKLLESDNFFYYMIPYHGYNLGTKISKHDLFYRVNTLLMISLVAILAIALFSFFHAVKLSQILTKPIYKLVSVLEKNREGAYSKVTLEGDEEIEYFALKYNEMITRVSNFTAHLEEEVDKRTKELKRISQTDTLTGVYNREKLNEIVLDKRKQENIYSIIITDIDDFKKINDKYGHAIGDEILKEFSSILKSSIRGSDFLGRWGGEEFIIICPNATSEQATKKAEQIRQKIEETTFNNSIRLTSSFGISQYKDNISYDALFILADEALYEAKSKGKNRVVFK